MNEYDTFFDSMTYLDSNLDYQVYDDCIGLDLIDEIQDVFNYEKTESCVETKSINVETKSINVETKSTQTKSINVETSDNSTQTLNISCNCTKNQCLKKYCVCRKEGIECNDYCNCTGCKNRS